MLSALSLPDANQKVSDSLRKEPAALAQWLASLPLLNVQASAASVLDQLVQLNASELDVKTRYQLLQHYQHTVLELARIIQPEQANPQKQDVATTRQQLGFLTALQLELLNGLKLCLCHYEQARFVFGRRPIPDLLADLLAGYLSLMWTCYRAYMAIPDGAWRELHAVFKFATTKGLVDWSERGKEAAGSLLALYKEALLLDLVDPRAFAVPEQTQVRQILRRHLTHATLKRLQDVAAARDGFLVLLDQDLPPALPYQEVSPESGVAIWLDTAPLLAQLQRLIERMHADTLQHAFKPEIPLAIWQRVARRFDQQVARSFNRKHDSGHIEVVYGLRAACFYLNQMQPLLPLLAEDEVLSQAMLGSDFAEPAEWEIQNVSPGGYALRLELGDAHLPCRVGDLLLAREFSRPRWMLATVRWQTVDLARGLTEIGIEVLSLEPKALLVKPAQNRHASYLHALSLPEWTATNKAALIMAPRGTFGPMRELLAHDKERSVAIRASRLIEHTVSYELFEYYD